MKKGFQKPSKLPLQHHPAVHRATHSNDKHMLTKNTQSTMQLWLEPLPKHTHQNLHGSHGRVLMQPYLGYEEAGIGSVHPEGP